MAWRNIALRVGLVNVPLGIDPATDKGDGIVAHTYDRATKARVKQAWTTDGAKLSDDVFRAYDVDGELIEAERVADDCARDFVAEAFVAPLDSLWLDASYFVSAGKGHESEAGLFARLLRDSGAWLVGTVRLTDRKRSAVLRYSDSAGALVLSVLTYSERVRWTKGATAGQSYGTPSDEAVAQGSALLDALSSADFAPLDTDTVAERLRVAIATAAGDAPAVVAEDDAPATDGDALLDAMRATLSDMIEADSGGKAKQRKTKTTA